MLKKVLTLKGNDTGGELGSSGIKSIRHDWYLIEYKNLFFPLFIFENTCDIKQTIIFYTYK